MENTEETASVQKKLDNLEISATIPTVKLLDEHLPIRLNPFYYRECSSKESDIETIFGVIENSSKCTCSNKKNNKTIQRNKEDTTKCDLVPLVHNIKFKSKHKKNHKKNNLIKEPILKDVGKCLNNCALTLIGANNKNSQDVANDSETQLSLELKSNLKIGKESKEHIFGQKESLSDFKSLLELCANISISSSSLDYSQKSFKILRDDELLTSKNRHRSKTPPTNIEVPTNSASCSSSSSCSQQARMQCDVTINEIASYFELLYIPKKMSTMAESMYI